MPPPDHYATLGLDRSCTLSEIRAAFRRLAKRYHPDVISSAARGRIQAINAAYEILRDPARRRAYDHERDGVASEIARSGVSRLERNVTQEVRLRIEEFLRGATIEVQVRDAGNPSGPEVYRLQIPTGTAPGARFRLPRSAPCTGGWVLLRLKVLPSYRFKVRGSDLQCELRIDNRRATEGGTESLERPTGGMLRVPIPARIKRGAIVRVPGEGMPKARGGRGDLLVRITYRPEVRISRTR